MAIPQHLLDAEYVNLATRRKNGDMVPTPIWAAPVGTNLYVFTAGNSGKVKRIKNFSEVELAQCNAGGKLLGGWTSASAYIVNDPLEVQNAILALEAKYGWKMKMTDFGARLTGRYQKRAYLRLEMP